MKLIDLKSKFTQGVWLIDCEYATPPGDPVIPVCVVGRGSCSRANASSNFSAVTEVQKPISGRW